MAGDALPPPPSQAFGDFGLLPGICYNVTDTVPASRRDVNFDHREIVGMGSIV